MGVAGRAKLGRGRPGSPLSGQGGQQSRGNGNGHVQGDVQITGMSQWFNSRSGPYQAVRDVSLTLEAGQFVALVGPSGCGKSTLLNAIAGLQRPTIGDVRIDGHPVDGVDRSVGYLFQRDALLPWRTVLGNVMLPLSYRQVPPKEARERARAWLARVQLGKFENHYPHQLSGGMKKRVALASVFVYGPRVLLMDEPFSALDVQTRNLMEEELLELWTESRPTVLFVTHDLEEAIGMADRVVMMTASPGRIKSDYVIDLPRPRALTEIRFEDSFQSYYERLWQDLRDEVAEAYEADTRDAHSAAQ